MRKYRGAEQNILPDRIERFHQATGFDIDDTIFELRVKFAARGLASFLSEQKMSQQVTLSPFGPSLFINVCNRRGRRNAGDLPSWNDTLQSGSVRSTSLRRLSRAQAGISIFALRPTSAQNPNVALGDKSTPGHRGRLCPPI